MNLEGAVRLGQRRELEAIADPGERERVYEEMVERMVIFGSCCTRSMSRVSAEAAPDRTSTAKSGKARQLSFMARSS